MCLTSFCCPSVSLSLRVWLYVFLVCVSVCLPCLSVILCVCLCYFEQEYLVVKVFKREYGLFLTFLQFFGYAACAALRRTMHGETERKIPLSTYFGLGFLQVGAVFRVVHIQYYIKWYNGHALQSARIAPRPRPNVSGRASCARALGVLPKSALYEQKSWHKYEKLTNIRTRYAYMLRG